MAYVGIAAELKQGLFHASINAFRSPLISWLIAAIPGLSPFQSGKLITIAAYLASIILLYAFTKKLWHSSVTAGLATLFFTFARGVSFDAVALISPDFLLTALTLVYFMLLLDCIREDRHWFWLGCVHGIAFLAKAIALPWLTVVTIAAVFASGNKRDWSRRVALAAIIPLTAAGIWAGVLHSKYGVFTTGTQFKTNLLQSTLREYKNHRSPAYVVLDDTSSSIDAHMVLDPMPPGSWAWSYKIQLRRAVPKILEAERTNLPVMMKALVILSNPGVLLGFLLLIWASTQPRVMGGLARDVSTVIVIILFATIALTIAYCMLVVDERYILPLFPLVIAIGSRFLEYSFSERTRVLRFAAWVLAIGGVLWSLLYPSSPFRVQRRDFQAICYEAGKALGQNPGTEIVSIGSGPFPEHGVGWEAGYKAAFFGEKRLIATDDAWPSKQPLSVLNDLDKVHVSAILVWGGNSQPREELLAKLRGSYIQHSRILDPILGDVGVVLFPKQLGQTARTRIRPSPVSILQY